EKLLEGLKLLSKVQIHGITEPKAMERRVPTVSFSVEGMHPDQLAQSLADENIFVWSGHNYAVEAVRTLGLLEQGGLLRVGPVHYNRETEIDFFLAELEQIL
ncbi:uncharacterized protein METZ01_LOCUS403256, partial [marine metagenome]